MRCVPIGCNGVTRGKSFDGAISKCHCRYSLYDVGYSRPVFMTMQANMAAGLQGEHSQAQLAFLHSFDLWPQVDCLQLQNVDTPC